MRGKSAQKRKQETSQREDVEKMKETGLKDPPHKSKDKVIEHPEVKCVFKECSSSNYRGYYKVASFLPLFSILSGSPHFYGRTRDILGLSHVTEVKVF